MQTLVEGQAIKHEQYGTGVVTESNNERTTIDFDNHGVKKFVTSIWTAELIGEPPAPAACSPPRPPQVQESRSLGHPRILPDE